MRTNAISGSGLSGDHLDNMIRLAFLYGDELEAEQLADDGRCAEHADVDIIFRVAHKLTDMKSGENRKKRLNKLGNALRRTVNIAACFIIMAAVTVPVAMATIPELRTYVSGLLVEHHTTYADIRMYDEPLPPLDVPEGWKGDFYLSYIPEGYRLVDIDAFFNIVTYKNNSGHIFYFIESEDSDGSIMDNEDVEITYAEINGSEVMFMEKRNSDKITAVWTNGEVIFDIYGNVSMSEMVEMVYGVRSVHIQKLDFIPTNETEDVRKKW